MTTPAPQRLLLVGGASPLPSSVDIVSDVLTQARSRGIRTHLINREQGLAATGQVNQLADAVSAVNPEDPDACVSWVRDRDAVGERFDIVLGLRDPVQPATSAVATAIGAPGNPIEAVHRVQNKDVCRAVLSEAGFQQPRVRLCETVDEAGEVMRESPGPWVIKPRDGAGSVGVRKVATAEDLAVAHSGLPDRGSFLIEEFVSGPEFSVEGVFLGGEPTVLAVTEKETWSPPYFVERGHVLPADIDEESREEIEFRVSSALCALGLRFGVFHVELWLTKDGIVLGEVHARPGGGWIHRLLNHALPGFELFGSIFDDLSGRPVHRMPAQRVAAAGFLSAPPGRLLEVRGWDHAVRHPGVLFGELFVEPGDEISPVRDSGARTGVIAVGAEDAAQAKRLARLRTESVEFRVEPTRTDRNLAGQLAGGERESG